MPDAKHCHGSLRLVDSTQDSERATRGAPDSFTLTTKRFPTRSGLSINGHCSTRAVGRHHAPVGDGPVAMSRPKTLCSTGHLRNRLLGLLGTRMVRHATRLPPQSLQLLPFVSRRGLPRVWSTNRPVQPCVGCRRDVSSCSGSVVAVAGPQLAHCRHRHRCGRRDRRGIRGTAGPAHVSDLGARPSLPAGL